MEKPHFDARPALLSAAGALIVMATAIFRGNFADPSTWLLLLGALLAGAGAWWYRRRTREPDRVIESEKAQLQRDREAMDRDRRALALFKTDVEEEALTLEKRRHKLCQQLSQTVGWWNLDDMHEDLPELPASEEKERQVLAFCRAESERLFNKIIANGYVKDGVLEPEEIYRDVISLFEGVAHIYGPDSHQPLLETSMEQVLRFLHNVSLQLLVQLEQLPIDVKSLNFGETYRFVKKAMDYYGMYKKVNPYWNYAKPAIFVGRFALGANPIALGLSWTITELASLSGKRISSRYTRKYGLRLFHEAIRIIGSETAAVYGANFRERDPDWVYATELIEMVHHFPPGRDSLEAGLKEIGRLPLHSEYDRVYLYRCLANRFSAKPHPVRARGVIGMTDSVQVAKRLEDIFDQFYMDEDSSSIQRWRSHVEARLGVKLQLTGVLRDVEEADELLAAFYSLASYLLGHKMLELEIAEKHLSASRIASAMTGEDLSKCLLGVRQAPPMVFDHPEHILAKKVAHAYLLDLIDFQLEVFPREADTTIVEETAAYFREKAAPWVERIDDRCRDLLLSQLLPEAPSPQIEQRAAQALLAELAPDERLQLIYPVSGVEGGITFQRNFKSLMLVGSNRRPLALIGFEEFANGPVYAFTLWLPGGHALELNHSKTFLTQAYRLGGGTWNTSLAQIDPKSDPPVIRMRSRRGPSHANFFEAFRERFRQLTGQETLLLERPLEDFGETETIS